jgi:glutaredoxin
MPEANGSSSQKELVVYTRTTYCPYQARASRVFEQHDLHPREILIDMDQSAMDRVINWTGFKSVPTIIAAPPGGDMPFEEPAPLARGASPRGVDRGSMITEATEDELTVWLRKHGFIE